MVRVGRWIVGLVPLLFVGWFVLWPLTAILGRGLAPNGSLSLHVVGDVLGEHRTQRIIWFTLWQSVVSTGLAVVIGVAIAYCIERVRLPGHGFVRTVVMLPFALPTLVVAAGFVALVGQGSWFAAPSLIPSTTIVIVAHVYFNVAIVVRVVGTRWRSLDPHLWHAASTLGQARRSSLLTLTAPLLAPAIAGAASIVMLFCFTSFGVVLALGGARQSTIETEIYRLTTQELALDRAAVLVVVQLVAVGVTMLMSSRMGRTRYSVRSASRQVDEQVVLSRRTRCAWTLLQWLVVALVLVPLGAIVSRAIGGGLDGVRFLNDSKFGEVRPIDSVWTSVTIACWSTVIAVTVGAVSAFALARRRRFSRVTDVLLVIPLGVSAVTIGFGSLIALDRPFDLRSSWFIVPIAQATIAVPFVVRMLLPTLQTVGTNLGEAAAVLGADRAAVLRTIDLPLIRRGFLGAATFAFAISLGEFGATAFIARAGEPTMPLMIARLLGRPGSAARSGAYLLAVVLLVMTFVLATLAERASATRRSVL